MRSVVALNLIQRLKEEYAKDKDIYSNDKERRKTDSRLSSHAFKRSD
jgi:hypothetical protein